MSHTVPTILVAALVVLAGCAGGIAGPDATGTESADDSGTVQFYVSDEENAIGQFEHLNVTVTSVGFKKGEAGGDADASGDASANTTDNETTTTTTVETTTAANETATTTAENASEETETEEPETETNESEDSGDGERVERDVDSRTVDLTELQGANATLLGNLSVPSGEYETVFVHVGEVNGTLKTGEQVNVKLPSQKLHLNKDVEVTSAGSVNFVFDITVFEAGNSGKFILEPVASESGTDVPIDVVGGDDEDERELRASVVGNVSAGENATVKVTQGGEPVADAEVRVDEEVVATTDANGTATVQVPADVEEFELQASTGEDSEYGEGEAELEFEFDESEDSEADDDETNASTDLAVAFEGSFTAGENVTVVVTDDDGEAVENATVAVDGDVVGETNADGELTFGVPANASVDSEVTVTSDDETVTVDASTVVAAN
ncbi:DUF4382 domain-containing protein [Halobacterium wangiae]|uniref:DUF4382 domain-containing protein n=1 Tax=Halobacterium wangiae TaxID=2902623 RepID=UPI001E4BBED4|nr:DUF4382 domain-containing protein [Halobacterium wangiae]